MKTKAIEKTAPKNTSSGLIVSVTEIQKVRSRNEAATSDGGGSGRSDSNDKNQYTSRG